MPRGNVLEYDDVRQIGFVVPDVPRRDGAAVRIDKKTMVSDSIRKGSHVAFEYGPYGLFRGGKKRGPTAASIKLIEHSDDHDDDRREQYVTTLYGENDVEWF
jgi:hypothetical protein